MRLISKWNRYALLSADLDVRQGFPSVRKQETCYLPEISPSAAKSKPHTGAVPGEGAAWRWSFTSALPFHLRCVKPQKLSTHLLFHFHSVFTASALCVLKQPAHRAKVNSQVPFPQLVLC